MFEVAGSSQASCTLRCKASDTTRHDTVNEYTVFVSLSNLSLSSKEELVVSLS